LVAVSLQLSPNLAPAGFFYARSFFMSDESVSHRNLSDRLRAVEVKQVDIIREVAVIDERSKTTAQSIKSSREAFEKRFDTLTDAQSSTHDDLLKHRTEFRTGIVMLGIFVSAVVTFLQLILR
jgi:hypothetical protein